jgi:phage portal protein BeeE
LTNSEIFQRLAKDLLFYGNAYIDPEKEDPLDPETTEIHDHDKWRVVDGFFEETFIWIRKR